MPYQNHSAVDRNEGYSSPGNEQSEPEDKNEEGYSLQANDQSEPEEKDEQGYWSQGQLAYGQSEPEEKE